MNWDQVSLGVCLSLILTKRGWNLTYLVSSTVAKLPWFGSRDSARARLRICTCSMIQVPKPGKRRDKCTGPIPIIRVAAGWWWECYNQWHAINWELGPLGILYREVKTHGESCGSVVMMPRDINTWSCRQTIRELPNNFMTNSRSPLLPLPWWLMNYHDNLVVTKKIVNVKGVPWSSYIWYDVEIQMHLIV